MALNHVLGTVEMDYSWFSECPSSFIARVWKHWWWTLARPRKHLLADQPGHLQAASDSGRLDRTQDLCRVRQLPCRVWGRLLQAASGPIPWQRWRLSYLAQQQAVYHTGQRQWRLRRWVECRAREGHYNYRLACTCKNILVSDSIHCTVFTEVPATYYKCNVNGQHVYSAFQVLTTIQSETRPRK